MTTEKMKDVHSCRIAASRQLWHVWRRRASISDAVVQKKHPDLMHAIFCNCGD